MRRQRPWGLHPKSTVASIAVSTSTFAAPIGPLFPYTWRPVLPMNPRGKRLRRPHYAIGINPVASLLYHIHAPR